VEVRGFSKDADTVKERQDFYNPVKAVVKIFSAGYS
jgi:hypothetical protein